MYRVTTPLLHNNVFFDVGSFIDSSTIKEADMEILLAIGAMIEQVEPPIIEPPIIEPSAEMITPKSKTK